VLFEQSVGCGLCRQELSFIDMEIRYGVLQIAEALFYLHTTERLLHLNVCPQNVIVTKRGTWKLTGLCFTQSIGSDAQSNVSMDTHTHTHTYIYL